MKVNRKKNGEFSFTVGRDEAQAILEEKIVTISEYMDEEVHTLMGEVRNPEKVNESLKSLAVLAREYRKLYENYKKVLEVQNEPKI